MLATTRMNSSCPKQGGRTQSFDVELQSVFNSPLMKTNEVIPESDQSRVRGLLQDIESELETIDTEITRAQEYILLLQDKRAEYVEHTKKLRPAIAPHKSLPPEILVEIFLHYAAENAEQVINEALIHRRLSQFPWVLGHICSRWRQIALAEPRIWGTIGVSAVGYGSLLMLNEAFRRGGQSQLWLSAGEGANEKYMYDGFLRDVIYSQSKRITELSLFVFAATFKNFFSLPSDSFPVLESVLLVAKGPGLPRMPDSDASVFEGAERLRRIKILTPLEVNPIAFPMDLCLCWPQLTHIDFPEISIQLSFVHNLMNLCTNLCECHIRLENNWENLPPVWIKSYPPSSIYIPYLWRLEVHQEEGLYEARLLNDFLRPLVLPNLQQFDFSLEEELDVPILSELTAIISKLSRPNLVSEMSYLDGDPSELTEMTDALPFVTSLAVRRGALAPSEISMMAKEDHLPNLTSLITGVAYADMDDFIDMLEIRWVRGTAAQLSGCSTAGVIRSAKIYVANSPTPHSVSRFSRRICEIQNRLKLKDAMIQLQPIVR